MIKRKPDDGMNCHVEDVISECIQTPDPIVPSKSQGCERTVALK